MIVEQVNLEAVCERAQRQLDGMTVNRDTLALDVQSMAGELRYWRTAERERVETIRRKGLGGAFDSVFDTGR